MFVVCQLYCLFVCPQLFGHGVVVHMHHQKKQANKAGGKQNTTWRKNTNRNTQNKQTDKQTNKQANKPTNQPTQTTNQHTNKQTHIYKHT